ncbi:MAG: NFACT family protein [Myxococcota bacterium]
MSMNEAELSAVVDDLQSLVGAAYQNIWQPQRDRVILGLSDGTNLLMVPRGPLARLHPVRRRPRNPPKPFSFQGAGRSRLRGPLIGIDKVIGERAVIFRFIAAELHLRLTGRSGGLWLLQDDRVVAAYDGPAPEALPDLPPRPQLVQEVRFEPIDGSMARGADRYFSRIERDRQTVERRGLVEKRLRRSISRAQRLVGNLERDLLRAEDAPHLRAQADLLAASLHRVPKGADHIVLEGYDGEGPVHIDLDPGKPATATMELLYRRARRLDRVADRVLARLEEVEKQLGEHRDALATLDQADLEALKKLEQTLPALPSGGRAPTIRELPWHTWVGPDGERVLVGRNAVGNRRLTFQVAKGTDWWMHLRERPGAHLVLPMKRDQSPTLPHLLAAAQIALVHGKVPEGESVDVQYARVRDVRPIPGELAKVRIADERVLRVTRDPSELVGWAREEPSGSSRNG